MNNFKLQAALDELERLHDTVKEFKTRNGKLPNPDSDAGRAVSTLEAFARGLKRLRMPPRFIARQLSHPTGFVGRIVGRLMNRHNAT